MPIPKKKQKDESESDGGNGKDQEFVLTFGGETGDLVKIEKIDSESGERSEVSDDEYEEFGALLDPYGESAMEAAEEEEDPYAQEADYYQELADGTYDSAEQAYYQGMADRAAEQGALVAAYESSEEEAAYLQGVADYDASLDDEAGDGEDDESEDDSGAE